MIRRLFSLLALLLVFLSLPADAAEPLVRAILRTEHPVAGQPLSLDVQVLAPDFFLSAPQFPQFELPGAVVTLPEQRAVNFTETIDSQGYAGIQQTYTIIPQVPGSFTLPPARIDFTYAATAGQPTSGTVHLPQQGFEVDLPAGAQEPGGTLPTVPIEITQALDRPASGLKVGDALTRTITLSAEGLPAMMLPPPEFTPVDGLRLYRHDPVLEGEQRTDSATYIAERPGTFALPAIVEPWFDTTSNAKQIAQTPVVTLTVAAAPSGPAIAPEAPPRSAQKMDRAFLVRSLSVAIAGGGAFWFLCRLFPFLRRRVAARRAAYAQSEPGIFAQVRRAGRSDDRSVVHRALMQWSSRAGIGSLRAWAGIFGDASLQTGIADLERDLFAHPVTTAPWKAGSLLAALEKARKRWRRVTADPSRPAVPPLNPWDNPVNEG